MASGAIVVTGASRGIGAAIAIELATAGYVVGCLSRSGGLPAGATASDLFIPVTADVCDPDALKTACATVAERAPLVGLVNNAGLHSEAKSIDLTAGDWSRQMDVNAFSVVVGCQAAFPYLEASGGGLIVNIGSFFDKLGVKRNLAYCASKAAVGAITRVLAVEWASKAIRVVNVAPGYVVTDLNREGMQSGPLRAYLEKRIPAGAPTEAADIARLVAGLFTIDCRFLTGETIYVDGAQGIAH
jgi:NAD(P)-dependent dehydrogenase (short-subunit alcohol dehydrogenase family)